MRCWGGILVEVAQARLLLRSRDIEFGMSLYRLSGTYDAHVKVPVLDVLNTEGRTSGLKTTK